MSAIFCLLGRFTVVIAVLLLCSNNILFAEPSLQNDRLFIKFVDGAHISRSVTETGVMLVGIESVDSLSVRHHSIYYVKLARDFPESSNLRLPYATPRFPQISVKGL